MEVGARVRGTVRVAGRRSDFVYEVVQFDPPERLVDKTVESPIPFRVTQHYEVVVNGTPPSTGSPNPTALEDSSGSSSSLWWSACMPVTCHQTWRASND